MPTLQALQREPWWPQEFQPPNLAELCRQLREFYDVGAIAIGSKGDENHLRGYHRSAAWIRNSAYCTNRSYSVSETTGNRNPGDDDWLCAIDMTIPRDKLIAACQRLDEAVRAGRLEKITEWYGNDDGDNRVDGYDNIRNRVATSDDSHLWHLHMSFDRGRANEDHSDVFAILTGEDMALSKDDIAAIAVATADKVWHGILTTATAPSAGTVLLNVQSVLALVAKKVDLDPAELAQIAAVVKASTPTADEVAAAVVAALPPASAGGLTEADVEAAVRTVFADAGTAD